ncbi:helix-turn-helix domain-containing protein [Serratia fonticola]|uniref:helix-turn-helix domain-containing protein n=1 Tax=Serratia fonticola TaxID=47917 RepID=UPI0021BACA67|nr:helix-turn-helix transcriptional regulator [Serratia fonticola]
MGQHRETYQEIAIILDVKARTIKFHIGNIVKKMGVTNAKHAIRLGPSGSLSNRLPAEATIPA